MRDFDWTDVLFAVVKDDGSFAGVPCLSLDEAKELADRISAFYNLTPEKYQQMRKTCLP